MLVVARLIVYRGFIEARATVWSDRVGENIDSMLRTIEEMPGVGSSIVPEAVIRVFGPNIRRAVVSPFEIIYEYNQEEDIVYVYDLLYGPMVR